MCVYQHECIGKGRILSDHLFYVLFFFSIFLSHVIFPTAMVFSDFKTWHVVMHFRIGQWYLRIIFRDKSVPFYFKLLFLNLVLWHKIRKITSEMDFSFLK
jgi:hypothetical protein